MDSPSGAVVMVYPGRDGVAMCRASGRIRGPHAAPLRCPSRRSRWRPHGRVVRALRVPVPKHSIRTSAVPIRRLATSSPRILRVDRDAALLAFIEREIVRAEAVEPSRGIARGLCQADRPGAQIGEHEAGSRPHHRMPEIEHTKAIKGEGTLGHAEHAMVREGQVAAVRPAPSRLHGRPPPRQLWRLHDAAAVFPRGIG